MNIQTSPPEAHYILRAREFVQANKLKNKYTREESAAKIATVQAMHAVQVSTFDFVANNATYNAAFDRPVANRVSVERLYKLFTDGDIGLPDFLACITSSQKACTDTLGKAASMALLETFQKSVELLIKPKE